MSRRVRRLALIVTAQMIASIIAPGTSAQGMSAAPGKAKTRSTSVRSSVSHTRPGSSMQRTSDSSCYRIKDDEKAFAKKANSARARRNKGKLRLDPELSRVARQHTREMVKKGMLFHTTSSQFDRRITNWTMVAENVGYGSNVGELHSLFMNSPLHAANIMNGAYKFVGVGVVTEGSTMWVTVIFEAAANPGTTLKMPRC